MIESATFRMADRLAGGQLVEMLRERRVERRQSYDQIARELYAEHGIEVTRQTLASWWADIEAAELKAAAT